MHRHQLVGGDGVVGVEHALGEAAHDGFSCKMKVAEHLVRSPAAEEPDDVGVDFGDEEGHGAASSEGAGGHLFCGEAKAKAKKAYCHPQMMSDVGWGYTLGGARCKEDPSQGSMGRGIVRSEMDDTADDGQSRAAVWISTAAKFDDFVWDAILLGREGKGGRASQEELIVGGRVEVEPGGSIEELDITQGEGCGVGRGVGVFPWTKEVEEGYDDHIRHGL